MDKFEFIKTAYNLTLPESPQSCKAICAMTGLEISQGYNTKDIISSASADIADVFPYGGSWVSENAGILFKASSILRGNLLVLEGEGLRPLISKDSAIKENRPCWRDLIMNLPLNIPTVAIFSDESKRRLWPNAKLSLFGDNWQPFFNGIPYHTSSSQAAPSQRNLRVNVTKLREVLSLVEYCYGLGFSKWSIAKGLYSATDILGVVGFPETKRLDQALSPYRNSDEFLLASFVAQKEVVEIIETIVEPIIEVHKPIVSKPKKVKESQQACLF